MGPVPAAAAAMTEPAAPAGATSAPESPLREFRFRLLGIDRCLLYGGLLRAASPIAAVRVALEKCATVARICRDHLPGVQILEVGESGSDETWVELVDVRGLA